MSADTKKPEFVIEQFRQLVKQDVAVPVAAMNSLVKVIKNSDNVVNILMIDVEVMCYGDRQRGCN